MLNFHINLHLLHFYSFNRGLYHSIYLHYNNWNGYLALKSINNSSPLLEYITESRYMITAHIPRLKVFHNKHTFIFVIICNKLFATNVGELSLIPLLCFNTQRRKKINLFDIVIIFITQ